MTMKRVLIALTALLFGALGLGRVQRPAIATPDSIPVVDADAVFEADTVSAIAPELAPLIDQVPSLYMPPRGANGVFWSALEPVSGTLEALIATLPGRYMPVQGSNGTHWFQFAEPGTMLQALVDQLPAWISPQGANGVFHSGDLVYPVELIGDTIPPQLFSFDYEPISGLVEWHTDEFAISEVWYGTEFGSYTGQITSTVWVTTHQFLIPTSGAPYLLVRCTDRSGNISDYYEPGFEVSGRCSDAEDNPIAGARVSLSATQVTQSDQNGDYKLRGVPAGEHVLTVWHPDYTFDPPTISIVVSENMSGQDFVGTPGQEIYLPVVVRN